MCNCNKNKIIATLICLECGRLIKFKYRSRVTLESAIRNKRPHCFKCGSYNLEAKDEPEITNN